MQNTDTGIIRSSGFRDRCSPRAGRVLNLLGVTDEVDDADAAAPDDVLSTIPVGVNADEGVEVSLFGLGLFSFILILLVDAPS